MNGVTFEGVDEIINGEKDKPTEWDFVRGGFISFGLKVEIVT
jgi:hypothetical protein